MLHIPAEEFATKQSLIEHYAAVRKRFRNNVVPLPVVKVAAVKPPEPEPIPEPIPTPAAEPEAEPRLLNSVAEIFIELGGKNAVARMMNRDEDTVRRWRRRGSLPAYSFDMLRSELRRRGAVAPVHLWRAATVTSIARDNVIQASTPIYRLNVLGISYPSIQEVLSTVCEFYAVTALDVISDRRQMDIVRPRQVVMYLARHLTLRSLPTIGRAIGGRDHTTVLHGFRKIERLLFTDERLADEIQLLRMKIGDRLRGTAVT